MAQSRSAPVVVALQDGWETRLAAAVDASTAELSQGMGPIRVTTTPLVAATAMAATIGRRKYESNTHGVLVTVTTAE